MKTAMITGVTGQDGSILARFLLNKGYRVYGVKRRSSTNNTYRLEDIIDHPNLTLVEGELTDPCSMNCLVRTIRPDELYNLAAMSHVATSFEQPDYTFQVDACGPLYLLEAVRQFSPNTRVYQAGSSEEFASNCSGTGQDIYQDENTPLMANSPYAAAKITARHLVHLYRRSYGVWACVPWLFNHESKYRGENFVTRKITKWLGDYLAWREKHKDYCLGFDDNFLLSNNDKFPKLRLGNIKTYRDWSHAHDMIRGMWMMLQRDEPDDFVLGSGETHTVEEFLMLAFRHVDILDYANYFVIDPEFYRPCDVPYLRANPAKANTVLGWKNEISFPSLVQEMVDYDRQKAKEG